MIDIKKKQDLLTKRREAVVKAKELHELSEFINKRSEEIGLAGEPRRALIWLEVNDEIVKRVDYFIDEAERLKKEYEAL